MLTRMAMGVLGSAIAVGVALAAMTSVARAEGPKDLLSAFGRAFDGVDACVALRDVAPGAGTAVSDDAVCARRLPPCATFELAAAVIALDRGVVPDAATPVKRNPPQEGDPKAGDQPAGSQQAANQQAANQQAANQQNGVNLRDAFRRPDPWVFEEVARRIGSEAFHRALAAMRYGNAETEGPVERLGRGDGGDKGLTLSAVEQVDFLARLKRGELPTSAESQARTVELMPTERLGDATIAWKSGACDGAAWAVGWVDRPQRSTIFASVASGEGVTATDVVDRSRRLMGDLALVPAQK